MGTRLRAIDLFCGIGGWSIGFSLADVDVVASYELWPAALETYNTNLKTNRCPIDIRQLNLHTLPKNIDIVIGSPPCTEFSFANKGGNGNLVEGLKDIIQFFRVVRYLQPRYWIMENVPRVSHLVEQGLNNKKSALYEFRELGAQIHIINFAEYGLPQNRTRSLIGNIPFENFLSYKNRMKVINLGDIIFHLNREKIVKDPIWATTISKNLLTENELESPLDSEQLRMNRDAKSYHPVYNNMAFPDRLDSPSRTVTATCTRVSRESIIVPAGEHPRKYRRLTVRERATLQGFPITYQFYSSNYTDKVKLIGNAMPPPIAYLIASAIQGVTASELKPFGHMGDNLEVPKKKAPIAVPNGRGNTFPRNRTFRAAIPSLRFKSGMRFELANNFSVGTVKWQISYFFGSSKDIKTLILDKGLQNRLRRMNSVKLFLKEIEDQFENLENILSRTTATYLQDVWCHRINGITPYQIVDCLGRLARKIAKLWDVETAAKVLRKIFGSETIGIAKMERHANAILAGLLIGIKFNAIDLD